MKNNTHKIALGGMMTALAAAVMLMGGVIPAATFCCPALAGLALIPLVVDCGKRMSWGAYAAISALSLMLCADKEAALLFCFLGYYPIVKWRFDRIPRPAPRWLAKLGLWTAAVGSMYALIFFVLRLDQVMADFQDLTRITLILTIVLGYVTLALYDRFLAIFAVLYIRRWRPKLFRS